MKPYIICSGYIILQISYTGRFLKRATLGCRKQQICQQNFNGRLSLSQVILTRMINLTRYTNYVFFKLSLSSAISQYRLAIVYTYRADGCGRIIRVIGNFGGGLYARVKECVKVNKLYVLSCYNCYVGYTYCILNI